MAYLKLNDSKIIYSPSRSENKLIVADIVNSDIGPKSGYRLIQTPTELDLWFGKNFTQRSFYLELLSNRIGLLLGRPMSFPEDTSRDSWERHQGFPEIPNSDVIYKVAITNEEYLWRETEFLRIDSFPEIHLPSLPGTPAFGLRYNIYGTIWIWIDSEFICLSKLNKIEVSVLPDYPKLDVVYLSDQNEEYIWDGESDYIRVEDLPENISNPERSESYLNRDTLRIYTDGLWCHPRLSEMPDYESLDITNITKDNLSKIESGDSSLAYLLDFSEVQSFYSDDSLPGFFVIPEDSEGKFQFIWYQRQGVDHQIPFGSDILGSVNYQESIAIQVSGNSGVSQIITETISKLRNKFKVYQISEKSYLIYSENISKNRNFYHLSGLKLEASYRGTNDLLQLAQEGKEIAFDFISETLGTTDENIKVGIDVKNKRISLERFGYQEVYEGDDFRRQINSESKLIRVGKRGKGYTLAENWVGEIAGGTPEEFTEKEYRDCLAAMKLGDFSEDFFLVPDIYKYHKPGSITESENYFSEYLMFLDYAKAKNCQVLINNIENPFWTESVIVSSLPEIGKEGVLYKIEIEGTKDYHKYLWEDSEWKNVDLDREKSAEDNFIWNYTEDKENRLIYFYHNIGLNTKVTRPGYYAFLIGLLINNYQLSTNLVIYNPPVWPYTEDIENLSDDPDNPESGMKNRMLYLLKNLEIYKSNYLVDNGQYYYYKNYFNGEDPISTWVVRFAMSRLSRQYMNKKWDFLAHQMLGEINQAIKNITEVFATQFSGIIKSAEVTDIKWEKNKIDIYIRVFIYELVDKDINLSLTLNYIS